MLPSDDVRVTVLHPAGAVGALPAGVDSYAVPGRTGPWGRLRYEQSDLPLAARHLGCGLLITLEGAPIASRVPVAALVSVAAPERTGGVLDSLRRAAGSGGRSIAALRLQFSDLEPVGRPVRSGRLVDPFVWTGFERQAGRPAGAYVLCHGLRRQQVGLAMAAWSWVDGSLGDSYPLLILGADSELEAFVRIAAEQLDLNQSIEFRPEVDLPALPSIYRNAAAYLGLGMNAGGQPLRWALASGVPVAAVEGPRAAAILGEAGYLAPAGDARALGAACLSLLVQEQLAERLRQRGSKIAAAYFGDGPLRRLRSVLQEAAGG